MQIPVFQLDVAAIEAIPVALWTRLFQKVGWPPSLEKVGFLHSDIMASFRVDEVSDDLLLALETLLHLGTASGAEAIREAIADRQVKAPWASPTASEQELAVLLFLEQLSDPASADVFVRAQIKAQETGDRTTYHDFFGLEPRPIAAPSQSIKKLKTLMLAFCKSEGLGDHVEVRGSDRDGSHVFQVLHSHHMKKPLAIINGRNARTTIEFRPVHCDILTYSGSSGRLRIMARAASMVRHYRVLMGMALFEDEKFFTGENLLNLRELQTGGQTALDRHRIPGVGRAWMTEFFWERNDGRTHRIKAEDCFEEAKYLKLPLNEGNLVEVKLKLQVAQKGTRPITVGLRVPGKVSVSSRLWGDLVDEYLKETGLRRVPAQSRKLDLWGLKPWRHRKETWQAVFGDLTDRLVKAEVLKRVLLQRVENPEHPDAGAVLVPHELGRGEYYGTSEVEEIPSRSLSTTDLEGLELDPEVFRQFLRKELGFDGASRPWEGNSAFLDLGMLSIEQVHRRIIYVIAPPIGDVGREVRDLCQGSQEALLVPRGRKTGTSLLEVPLDSPILSRPELERALVRELRMEDSVPAIVTASPEARLVVDLKRGKVWVDKVEIRGLKEDSQPFRFIAAMAEASPSPVSFQALTARLATNRDDGKAAARQAKADARGAITKALADAGKTLGGLDPFPSAGTGSYRCALAAEVSPRSPQDGDVDPLG